MSSEQVVVTTHTYTHTRAFTHARTHPHPRTHAHARTHARTHTHTHTHTLIDEDNSAHQVPVPTHLEVDERWVTDNLPSPSSNFIMGKLKLGPKLLTKSPSSTSQTTHQVLVPPQRLFTKSQFHLTIYSPSPTSQTTHQVQAPSHQGANKRCV